MMRRTHALLTAASLAVSTAVAAQAQTFPAEEASPPPQAVGQPPQQPARQPLQPAQQQPPANAVAAVNDTVITQQELDVHLQPHLQANPQIDQQSAMALRDEVLQTLIDGVLVQDYLRENGPEVAEEEVTTTVDRVKQQVQAQGTDYNHFLAQQGQTEESMKQRIEGLLAWQKYQAEAITEPKLQEYHEQNRQHFGDQQYDQVRPHVAQSYANGLWKAIADKARPEAEIKVLDSGQAPPTATPFGGQAVPETPPATNPSGAPPY